MKASSYVIDILGDFAEYNTITDSITLMANNKYIVDTSSNAVTLTLPSIANSKDQIILFDQQGLWETNNVTLTSSSKINGLDTDFILDLSGLKVVMIYTDPATGWKFGDLNSKYFKNIEVDSSNKQSDYTLQYNETTNKLEFVAYTELTPEPILSGDSNITEDMDATITIDNYDASYTYTINVTDGSFIRTDANIVWTAPSVLQDTTIQLSIRAEDTLSGYAVSNEVIRDLLVEALAPVGDSSVLIEGTDWNDGIVNNGITPEAIATIGIQGLKYFEMNGNSYLAVANWYSGNTYNLNSKIYKWNGTSFIEFQSIPTHGAYDWEYFEINGDSYIAVANNYNDTTYNIDSKIYKWNGTSFIEFQSIATHGAFDWEYFEINNDSYLAVANFYNGTTYNLNSKIYEWNGTSFIEYQSISTQGASDWEYFEMGGENYLAVGNSYNGTTWNVDSKIYKWNGTSFIEFQSIATNDINSWEYFEINGDSYLVVSNTSNGVSVEIDSKIYKWDGTSFIEFQSIATNNATVCKYFMIGTDSYLALANFRNDVITWNVDSKIYKWNGTSFIEYQSIPTHGATDWQYFEINGESYLAVANYYNDSTYNINSYIYKWNEVIEAGKHYDELNSVITNDNDAFVMTVPVTQDTGDLDWAKQHPKVRVSPKEYDVIDTMAVNDDQSIPTNGFDCEYFTIGNDNYLAIANIKNDTTFNINSNIYKWNTGTLQFDLFQSIATHGAQRWCYFTIGIDHYLALSNYYNGTTYNIDSYIYKWNTNTLQFDEYQSIATSGARDCKFFTIGNDHYLAIANWYNVITFNIDSKIYKWNTGTLQFDEYQFIATNSALGCEHFMIDTDHYLAVSNSYNDTTSTYNIDSYIYKWNTNTLQFDEYQSIATSGARNWKFFTIGNDHYLAIANFYNGTTYNIDSKIYKWNTGTLQFDEYQSIATNGAVDWEHFMIGTDHYLAVTNSYNGTIYNIDSKIYKWNTGTLQFDLYKSILTYNATDWEHFMIGTNHYLAVANQYNNSSYNTDSYVYKLSDYTQDGTKLILTGDQTSLENLISYDSLNGLVTKTVNNSVLYDGNTTLTVSPIASEIPTKVFDTSIPNLQVAMGTEEEYIPSKDIELTNLSNVTSTSVTGESIFNNLWITDGYHNKIGLTVNGTNIEVDIVNVSITGTGPYTYTIQFAAQSQVPTNAWKPSPFDQTIVLDKLSSTTSTYVTRRYTDFYNEPKSNIDTLNLTVNGSVVEDVSITDISINDQGNYKDYTFTFAAQTAAPDKAVIHSDAELTPDTTNYNSSLDYFELQYPELDFSTISNIRQLKYYMSFNKDNEVLKYLYSDLFKQPN